MSAKIVDQPPPVENDRPAIQDLVLADIAERKRIGIERYGRALQPHNGRDALVDAYQEVLDLAMYVRQEIEERADGAAAEREKIVGYMRHRARELDAYDAGTAFELAQAIEAGAHHDTWPAPPPESVFADSADTIAETPKKCGHGVSFDAKAAENMDAHEVRRRWPRLHGSCPLGCGYFGICYASAEHCVAGDW